MILNKYITIALFSFALVACGEAEKPEPQHQDQSGQQPQPDMEKVKESRDKMFK